MFDPSDIAQLQRIAIPTEDGIQVQKCRWVLNEDGSLHLTPEGANYTKYDILTIVNRISNGSYRIIKCFDAEGVLCPNETFDNVKVACNTALELTLIRINLLWGRAEVVLDFNVIKNLNILVQKCAWRKNISKSYFVDTTDNMDVHDLVPIEPNHLDVPIFGTMYVSNDELYPIMLHLFGTIVEPNGSTRFVHMLGAESKTQELSPGDLAKCVFTSFVRSRNNAFLRYET